MFNRTYVIIVLILALLLTVISTYLFLTQKGKWDLLGQILGFIFLFLFSFGCTICSLWVRVVKYKKWGWTIDWGPHLQLYAANICGLMGTVLAFFLQFKAIRENTYMPTVGVYAGLGIILGSFCFSQWFKDKLK